ncbi:MAG: SMP-30/gluconolactonase/LRE family protein [Pseudomonadota bacterium]
MNTRVHDARPCALGEGALWHPLRKRLFWFDILGKKLHCDDGQSWSFDAHVSAAGWVDTDVLLIASERALFTFNLETGAQEHLCDLEADDPVTRSNDGRVDPWGGFWIGTMGKAAEPSAGAIYRYYRGDLRRLYAPVTITNAICFAPDKSCAYWADSAVKKLFRVPLDENGWPAAAPALFLDFSSEDFGPDGAVVASDGSLLNAQWGGSRVARYSAEGKFIEAFAFPATQISCPALGGPDMRTLFATSAQQGMTSDQLIAEPFAGQTFWVDISVKGLPEYQVIL